MISYNDLYEILRKEKYSEPLQQLPKNFILEFSSYINENSFDYSQPKEITDGVSKSKKQFENSLSLFRELMLKRKRKILNLIFVAAETGIMKRDYENMMEMERVAFEKMVKSLEDCDKEISSLLTSKTEKKDPNKMILFKQTIEEFIDHQGSSLGPYQQGQLANLDSNIAEIFVTEGKAIFVDEN